MQHHATAGMFEYRYISKYNININRCAHTYTHKHIYQGQILTIE